MKRDWPREKRLALWHAIDVAITNGDLVLLDTHEFVLFATRPDASDASGELRKFLSDWKVELMCQLRKDAAEKARGERRAP